MQDIHRIALYFVGVLGLGAILAPWLYWGGTTLGQVGGVLAFLERVTFQRYFNRAMLVAAVALLWPLVQSLRVHSRAELGLEPNPRWGVDLARGFFAALGVLGALAVGFLVAGTHVWRAALPLAVLGTAALSAFAVAFLEEALFRGALLGVILRSSSRWAGQLFLAGLFALVHFLKPPGNAAEVANALGPIDAFSGFKLLPQIFWQFADPWLFLGGFSTLCAVGLVLGFARTGSRSLWLPIGLHAGWVFGLKVFSAWTLPTERAQLPWIGDSLLIGLLPFAAVLLTGVLAGVKLRPTR